MLSIPLGPFALPMAPVLLLAAVWGASWLASWLAGRVRGDGPATEQSPALSSLAGNTIVHAALFGLLAARLAHLALHADLYLATPLSALDVRDGGWHALAGALAGALWLLWRALQTPLLRRPLALASATGLALWLAAGLATGVRDTPALPAVALTDLSTGATLDLAQAARGRPVVVNLWASWCGPCRQEMPLLAEAQRNERSIGFLFVNQGESAETIRRYMEGQNLPLREVLLDPGSTLGPAVGSGGLPTTLFYDGRGRRVDAHFGVLNAAALEGRLRNLRRAP
ncbi:MAG: TlpA family protein disulfide reductase [Rhizobacter sp.]|nr:TlpA family protein disulfide reductase [Rhizobacter sp.]